MIYRDTLEVNNLILITFQFNFTLQISFGYVTKTRQTAVTVTQNKDET